jgi:3D (Asp-Asp-Asp) domain-containing protein
MVVRLAPLLLTLVFLASDAREPKTLVVTATAYNSLASQTTAIHSDVTAWGEKLKPGMKCIAVSRDLIALGLKYNTKVMIDGLEGEFLVKDKMHGRWEKRIDIYMGVDVQAARKWGKKTVQIKWRPKS